LHPASRRAGSKPLPERRRVGGTQAPLDVLLIIASNDEGAAASEANASKHNERDRLRKRKKINETDCYAAAHNGLVADSSPAGPTIFAGKNFPISFMNTRKCLPNKIWVLRISDCWRIFAYFQRPKNDHPDKTRTLVESHLASEQRLTFSLFGLQMTINDWERSRCLPVPTACPPYLRMC
jgi:hypothetical protein